MPTFPVAPPLLLWLLFLICCPSSALAENLEEEPRLPLAMEVLLRKPRTQVYELHVHLTNISKDVVTVNIRDLPWNPPNDSKWFSVVRMDHNMSVIEQPVQDWKLGSQLIKLVPGESIQDSMVLNAQIPSLLDDISQFGIQIRWSCPPVDLKFVCNAPSSQMLQIPKGDEGQPDRYAIDETTCKQLEHTIGLIAIPEAHGVLFLKTPEAVMEDLTSMHTLLYHVDDYVQQCQPSWTNSWGVSFFTDARYAGFLHEAKHKDDFKRGIWQQVNIGQYSSQTRTLFRFPWIKKRSDEVYLSVYR